MLFPPAECFATTGGTLPDCNSHHRRNAATAAAGDLVAFSLLYNFIYDWIMFAKDVYVRRRAKLMRDVKEGIILLLGNGEAP